MTPWIWLLACSGGPRNPDDPGSTEPTGPTAETGPTADTSPTADTGPATLPPALVGAWEDCSDPERGLAFTADGDATITDGATITPVTWLYQAPPDLPAELLRLDDVDGHLLHAVSVMLTADRLYWYGANPVGAVDGFVGQWHFDWTEPGAAHPVAEDYVVVGDGTVAWSVFHAARAPEYGSGTWTALGADRISVPERPVELILVDGRLTMADGRVYCRVR